MRPNLVRQLAAVLLVGVLLAGCSSPGGPEAETSPTPSSTPPSETVSPPAGAWRTEVWHEVQLEVPDSWKVGYAPVAEGDGALLCGIGVHEQTREPYVGRPGIGSDLCQRVELADLVMDGEGVWFGSPLPEGEVVTEQGLTQTTVAIGDAHVTVASSDDAVREHVLDTVEVVAEDANGCPARPRANHALPIEGYGAARYLSVCLYDGDGPGRLVREWSERLGRSAAEELVAAVEQRVPDACPSRCLACPHPGVEQSVLLRVHSEDRYGGAVIPQDYVVELGECPTLEMAARDVVLDLEPALVRPWATDGVSTYVVGSGVPRALRRYFRPIWG